MVSCSVIRPVVFVHHLDKNGTTPYGSWFGRWSARREGGDGNQAWARNVNKRARALVAMRQAMDREGRLKPRRVVRAVRAVASACRA